MVEQKEDQLDLDGILVEDDKTDEGRVITLEDKSEETVKTDDDNQPTPEDTIAALKKEIEASKVRESTIRDRAEKLESERAAEVKKATSAIDDAYKARETSVENAIAASQSDLTSIKRQLRDAREKGDIDTEIELEEKLADTRYNYNALNWQKNNLAEEKKRREDAVKAAPVEATPRHSAREQEWIENHPRYNSDDDYQAYVWSVDALAKKKGIVPNTDAYFEFLDARVSKMFPEDKGEEEVVVVPKKKAPASSTAAPASRSDTGGQRMGTNGKQVRLTADEIEAADYMGMTPAEYAQQKYEIEQEKKTGRA